jgi:hypothetical protein
MGVGPCYVGWITARQGKYIGGQPNLGVDIVDRQYVINEVEAKLVRRIFKLATQQQAVRIVSVKIKV